MTDPFLIRISPDYRNNLHENWQRITITINCSHLYKPDSFIISISGRSSDFRLFQGNGSISVIEHRARTPGELAAGDGCAT